MGCFFSVPFAGCFSIPWPLSPVLSTLPHFDLHSFLGALIQYHGFKHHPYASHPQMHIISPNLFPQLHINLFFFVSTGISKSILNLFNVRFFTATPHLKAIPLGISHQSERHHHSSFWSGQYSNGHLPFFPSHLHPVTCKLYHLYLQNWSSYYHHCYLSVQAISISYLGWCIKLLTGTSWFLLCFSTP